MKMLLDTAFECKYSIISLLLPQSLQNFSIFKAMDGIEPRCSNSGILDLYRKFCEPIHN